MAFDLRKQSWIPWYKSDGTVTWGMPADLAASGRDTIEVPVGIAAPRPDFAASLQEFLIGLLAVALLPEDEEEWRERWYDPPTSDDLQKAFDALPDAFNLDGDGPRVFQDLSVDDFAAVKPTPISQLLIDSPGEQTLKLNKDLFIKRGRVDRLGRPAAAMALITMQTYAPAGGQGHRTSLRGGGPLTTLVDPRVDRDGKAAPGQPLWRKLWANVPTREWLMRLATADRAAPMETVFPWLAPTRVSDPSAGGPVTPDDAHPLQAFFGLPRRIRLEFDQSGICDLTGQRDEVTVTGFRMRNYGVQYMGWRHPLSPHYKSAKAEMLPVHGQPGGIVWRDWLGFSLREPSAAKEPAAAVVNAVDRRARAFDAPVVRVHAFGYDMDNMKARGWTDATLPAFPGLDADRERLVALAAQRAVAATDLAAGLLVSAIKRALFENSDGAGGDYSGAKIELWTETTDEFQNLLWKLAVSGSSPADVDEATAGFAPVLERVALAIFDRWCPSEATSPTAMRRLVGARFSLVMAVRGKSKMGVKLFDHLGIPREAPPSTTKRKTNRGREKTT
jgi:CRISPR system Cascade subunit CasA